MSSPSSLISTIDSNHSPSVNSTERAKIEMKAFLDCHCLSKDVQINLSTGESSDFYFDCKPATLCGEFLVLLCDWILDEILPQLDNPNTVGGLTIGADPVISALIMRAHQRQLPLTSGCIVRKEAKKHGLKSKIENNPRKKASILVVEDVITSGGSISRACDELIDAGHKIAGIFTIVDRLAGGRQKLEKKYKKVPVFSLFTRNDFFN